MKKILFLTIFISSLVLTACSNTDQLQGSFSSGAARSVESTKINPSSNDNTRSVINSTESAAARGLPDKIPTSDGGSSGGSPETDDSGDSSDEPSDTDDSGDSSDKPSDTDDTDDSADDPSTNK